MARRRVATITSLVVLAGLLLFSAGCGGSGTQTEIKQADAAKGVKINVGDQFSLILDSNASTGFSWRVAEPTNEQVIKKISNNYIEPNTGLAGAGGTENWVFEGAHPGVTTIKMQYVRPWVTNESPDTTVDLEVTVNP
jgi:predicted secreted protein